MPFFQTHVILIPIVTWVLVHVIKIALRLGNGEPISMALFRSGGMPSAHSAFIMSVTAAIAVIHGVFSPTFTLSLCFSSIVLYDAIHVRYQTGEHAKVLNELLQKKGEQARFPTSVGHTPEEMIVGAFLGTIIGFILPVLPFSL